MKKIKIVFVCLGNYCRSPMAEAIFKDLAQRDGTLTHFDIASAGTKDWDVGCRPDYRTRQVLDDHNILLDPNKHAQKITSRDIKNADYLVAMTQNIANQLGHRENVHLLMDFVSGITDKDIPDPYPTNSFMHAFEMISRGINAFYAFLKEIHPI